MPRVTKQLEDFNPNQQHILGQGLNRDTYTGDLEYHEESSYVFAQRRDGRWETMGKFPTQDDTDRLNN